MNYLCKENNTNFQRKKPKILSKKKKRILKINQRISKAKLKKHPQSARKCLNIDSLDSKNVKDLCKIFIEEDSCQELDFENYPLAQNLKKKEFCIFKKDQLTGFDRILALPKPQIKNQIREANSNIPNRFQLKNFCPNNSKFESGRGKYQTCRKLWTIQKSMERSYHKEMITIFETLERDMIVKIETSMDLLKKYLSRKEENEIKIETLKIKIKTLKLAAMNLPNSQQNFSKTDSSEDSVFSVLSVFSLNASSENSICKFQNTLNTANTSNNVLRSGNTFELGSIKYVANKKVIDVQVLLAFQNDD